MIDENEPAKKPQRVVAHPLATWDLVELDEYVAQLRAEIARAEAAAVSKRSHKTVAEAFFKPFGQSTA